MDGWIAEWAKRRLDKEQAAAQPAKLTRSRAFANLLRPVGDGDSESSQHTDVDEDCNDDAKSSRRDPDYQVASEDQADVQAAQFLTLLKLDGLTPRKASREERRLQREIVREASVAQHLRHEERRMRLSGREPSTSEPRRKGVNAVVKTLLASQPAIVLK